jgi:hypothetical protein
MMANQHQRPIVFMACLPALLARLRNLSGLDPSPLSVGPEEVTSPEAPHCFMSLGFRYNTHVDIARAHHTQATQYHCWCCVHNSRN